jgi:transposase-like protein
MANNNIRLMARGSGVPFWKIAQVLGISEPTMTRRLRNELSAKEKAKIRVIIAKLKDKQ